MLLIVGSWELGADTTCRGKEDAAKSDENADDSEKKGKKEKKESKDVSNRCFAMATANKPVKSSQAQHKVLLLIALSRIHSDGISQEELQPPRESLGRSRSSRTETDSQEKLAWSFKCHKIEENRRCIQREFLWSPSTLSLCRTTTRGFQIHFSSWIVHVDKGEPMVDIVRLVSYFVLRYYTYSTRRISKSHVSVRTSICIRDTKNTRNLEVAGKLLRGCGG